jgi:hypothetical protein
VRHQADRAGSRFGLVGVIVGRLRRHCPQHEGQSKPRRPCHPQTHKLTQTTTFLLLHETLLSL